MSGNVKQPPDLNMAQILADIMAAKSCFKESKAVKPKIAKYLRGQVGFHIQQACEKLIKIQIYKALPSVDYSKIYKHNLQDLVSYANSENINIYVPTYIKNRMQIITSWEAEGRYDTHVVVKTNTLQKHIEEVELWHDELKKMGYK